MDEKEPLSATARKNENKPSKAFNVNMTPSGTLYDSHYIRTKQELELE